jgi:hypothetical protein
MKQTAVVFNNQQWGAEKPPQRFKMPPGQIFSLFPWLSTLFSEQSVGFPDVHVFNVKQYIFVYSVHFLL